MTTETTLRCEAKPLTLPPELIARGRQAARDMRAIEAAAGFPMGSVAARYDAAIAAIEAMEAHYVA